MIELHGRVFKHSPPPGRVFYLLDDFGGAITLKVMKHTRGYTGKGATAEELRAYYADYRKLKREEIRVRNRLWMRGYRRRNRREALQTKAKLVA